jgi:hypothetical protein
MLFKTQQLELAERASFWSVIYDEIALFKWVARFFPEWQW